MYSSEAIRQAIGAASGDVCVLTDPRMSVDPGPRMTERMISVLKDSGAGMVYADSVGHPRIDYQPGSIRDGFDFGPVVARRMRQCVIAPAIPIAFRAMGGG